MSEKLYRKKALSKINSPENLNEIICVTNPGVWFILTALLVLLLGALCWGFFGEIETTVPVQFTVTETGLITRLSTEEAKGIHVGTPARAGQRKCNVSDVRVDEEHNIVEIEVNNLTFTLITQMSGEIITEYLHPIDFLWK